MVACIDTDDENVLHWIVIYGYGLDPKRLYLANNGWMSFFGIILFGEHEILKEEFEARLVGPALACWGA